MITTDDLYTTHIKTVLRPLYRQYSAFTNRKISFDEWLWDNLPKLGEQVYHNIGDFFGGDMDDAASELGLEE